MYTRAMVHVKAVGRLLCAWRRAMCEVTKEQRQEIEDKILDEKMNEILGMISTFIGDRSDYPYKPAKIKAKRPLDYDPLIRQIRDFALENNEHGRRLGRVISAADKVLEALDERDKNGQGNV
jgi:hypothetical protein